MSPSTVEASPEQVARVLEVLQRAKPKALWVEQIRDQTGFTNEIIYAALHTLKREGTVMGRDPFAYDPNAVDTEPEDPEENS
jgi:DNA-binding IclR family transcriptional regulator